MRQLYPPIAASFQFSNHGYSQLRFTTLNIELKLLNGGLTPFSMACILSRSKRTVRS
ncbi:hypothetical protein H6F76_06505 [Leptolyngbya sp. FACHB-321]|nr:hypothetical protein [Leptolyngbya sp. FACHB-321]